MTAGLKQSLSFRRLSFTMVIALAAVSPARVQAQTIEQQYAEIATLVPEFGGFFFDADREALVVHLTQQNETSVVELRAAFTKVFGPSDLANMNLDNMIILEATYSWIQLQQWLDLVRGEGIDGLVLRGIDKQTNRLIVGATSLEDHGAAIEAELDRLGIPREAVNLTDMGGGPTDETHYPHRSSPLITVPVVLVFLVLMLQFITTQAVRRASRPRRKGRGPSPSMT